MLRVVMFVKRDGVRVERFAEFVERVAAVYRASRSESQEVVMELAELLVCGLERGNDSTLLREGSEMVE